MTSKLDEAVERWSALLSAGFTMLSPDEADLARLRLILTALTEERDEAREQLAAHDRAVAIERRRWREHPMMQRLDEVRSHIAGLRPGDAEWLATAQSEFMAAQSRIQALTEGLESCDRLFNEALPKFNWGASALDANAISLLNEVPLKVRALLRPTPSEQEPT